MTICCLSPNGVNTYRADQPPTRLIVGTRDCLEIFDRPGVGAPWVKSATALDGRHISSMMYEPGQGGIFAGAHNGGLYFSPDGGESWVERGNGITEDQLYTVSYAPRGAHNGDGVALYAGTEPARLFHSHDYGESWVEFSAIPLMPDNDKWTFPPPPHIAHVKNVVIDPSNPARFYVLVEQGALLLTEDNGETWRELTGYSEADDFVYRDVHQLAISPTDPNQLYMTTGIGIYRSSDGGETFERLTDRTFRIGYPDHIFISPLDERVIFASGARANPGSWRASHHAAGAVMRSTDRGRNWSQIANGLPSDARASIEAMSLASWPGGFSLFAGNTDGEVHGSDDCGDSWSLVTGAIAPVSKGPHYRYLQDDAAAHA